MNRNANPDHPIHELFVKRHSPYAFDPARPVDAATVHALIEAARWTMSSYNAQPWRYHRRYPGRRHRHLAKGVRLPGGG